MCPASFAPVGRTLAITENLDLAGHHEDALRSLGIVLAADLGMRERRAVDL